MTGDTQCQTHTTLPDDRTSRWRTIAGLLQQGAAVMMCPDCLAPEIWYDPETGCKFGSATPEARFYTLPPQPRFHELRPEPALRMRTSDLTRFIRSNSAHIAMGLREWGDLDTAVCRSFRSTLSRSEPADPFTPFEVDEKIDMLVGLCFAYGVPEHVTREWVEKYTEDKKGES